MKVTVKDLSATIELKQRGMELEIRKPNGDFLGDLVVTSTSIIWCNGKTDRARGQKISIPDFIKTMNAIGAKPKAKTAVKSVAVKGPAKKVAAKKVAAKKSTKPTP